MKKFISIILASVLACTSMVACNSADSNSDNGGSKDSKKSEYGCGSKYALNDDDYKHIKWYEENEVVLLADTLTFIEENKEQNYVKFALGDEEDYGGVPYYTVIFSGFNTDDVIQMGIEDSDNLFLLHKNAERSTDAVQRWIFLSKEVYEEVKDNEIHKGNVFFEDKIGDFTLYSEQGYFYTSAKEADAAYEKMIAEGGISTEKYRSVNSEE